MFQSINSERMSQYSIGRARRRELERRIAEFETFARHITYKQYDFTLFGKGYDAYDRYEKNPSIDGLRIYLDFDTQSAWMIWNEAIAKTKAEVLEKMTEFKEFLTKQ